MSVFENAEDTAADELLQAETEELRSRVAMLTDVLTAVLPYAVQFWRSGEQPASCISEAHAALAATSEDVAKWLEEAWEKGATDMLLGLEGNPPEAWTRRALNEHDARVRKAALEEATTWIEAQAPDSEWIAVGLRALASPAPATVCGVLSTSPAPKVACTLPLGHSGKHRNDNRAWHAPATTETLKADGDETCPRGTSDDPTHCEHWWDGEPCHRCGAPAMTEAQMKRQGMLDGPETATTEAKPVCTTCGGKGKVPLVSRIGADHRLIEYGHCPECTKPEGA